MGSPKATSLDISEVKTYRDLNSSSRPLVKPYLVEGAGSQNSSAILNKG